MRERRGPLVWYVSLVGAMFWLLLLPVLRLGREGQGPRGGETCPRYWG